MDAALLQFQSTHPLRGATGCPCTDQTCQDHFNPRTPCGVRPGKNRLQYTLIYFNPRTPCGVRRARSAAPWAGRDFNPRTPCGVRHAHMGNAEHSTAISIHAPLAGCDTSYSSIKSITKHFNPRTPCGVRLVRLLMVRPAQRFQSTHPLRGATRGA